MVLTDITGQKWSFFSKSQLLLLIPPVFFPCLLSADCCLFVFCCAPQDQPGSFPCSAPLPACYGRSLLLFCSNLDRRFFFSLFWPFSISTAQDSALPSRQESVLLFGKRATVRNEHLLLPLPLEAAPQPLSLHVPLSFGLSLSTPAICQEWGPSPLLCPLVAYFPRNPLIDWNLALLSLSFQVPLFKFIKEQLHFSIRLIKTRRFSSFSHFPHGRCVKMPKAVSHREEFGLEGARFDESLFCGLRIGRSEFGWSFLTPKASPNFQKSTKWRIGR